MRREGSASASSVVTAEIEREWLHKHNLGADGTEGLFPFPVTDAPFFFIVLLILRRDETMAQDGSSAAAQLMHCCWLMALSQLIQ